jgi:hypothetical protein
LVQRLSEARTAAASAEGRLDTYTRSLMEHTTESTERDVVWLDRLIEAERTARAGDEGSADGAGDRPRRLGGAALHGSTTIHGEGDTR